MSLIWRAWRFLQREGAGALARQAFRLLRSRLRLSRQRRIVFRHFLNRLRFRAVADPHKVIWVRPDDIEFTVVTSITAIPTDPGQVRGGSWDLDLVRVRDTVKYLGVRQHFEDGVAWEQTCLFGWLVKHLAQGPVDRCHDVEDVKRRCNSIDVLYRSIVENGFLLPSECGVRDDGRRDFVRVHIGRSGQLIFSGGGNHRLAIAKLLGIELIPVKVVVRHKQWQQLRDKVATQLREGSLRDSLNPDVGHPDLQDILAFREKTRTGGVL